MNLATLVLALAAAFGQAQPIYTAEQLRNAWADSAPSQPMTCRINPSGYSAWICKIDVTPVDVPAIQVTKPRRESYEVSLAMECDQNGDKLLSCTVGGCTCIHENQAWTCADKSRILLTDESGKRHCVKFQ